MLKLLLRRIHLGLGLLSGLFLICLSLTGALLIYAKDIQTTIQPEYWQVSPENTALGFDSITRKVQQATTERVELIMPEQQSHLAWQVKLKDNNYLSVNPYNGQILHQYDYYSTLYGFTMSLHRWLLYQDADNQRPLRNIVSIAALIFIIELLLGFYLWIKPKNRLKRLTIKPKAKFRILMYQLHTVLGVYLLLPLILIAFTGMAFNWKSQTQTVLEWLTLDQVETRPTPGPLPKFDFANTIQIDLAYKQVKRLFPEAQLFRIYLPKTNTDSLGFRIQNPGESHAYSWVWAQPETGEVIHYYDASKANFTTQAWNFKYKFHIGDFAGPIVQALWLVMTLLPLFFTVSGCYFWYKRHYK